jgi:hypothetical protein
VKPLWLSFLCIQALEHANEAIRAGEWQEAEMMISKGAKLFDEGDASEDERQKALMLSEELRKAREISAALDAGELTSIKTGYFTQNPIRNS